MTTVKIEHEPCVVCHSGSNRTDWLHHGVDGVGKAWHACDHHSAEAIHDALVHAGRLVRGRDINHGVPGKPGGGFAHKLAPVIVLPTAKPKPILDKPKPSAVSSQPAKSSTTQTPPKTTTTPATPSTAGPKTSHVTAPGGKNSDPKEAANER